jgi:hypothetical protein
MYGASAQAKGGLMQSQDVMVPDHVPHMMVSTAADSQHLIQPVVLPCKSLTCSMVCSVQLLMLRTLQTKL